MQAGSRHGPGPAPHARRPERRHRPPSEVRPPAGDPAGRPGSLARGDQRADRAGPGDSARGGHGGQPPEGCGLPRDGRARHLVHVERPHPLPGERVHAARRDLVRVPRDPARGSELRHAQAPERCPPAGGGAPRARPRHGRDRLGQDDDARVDAEPHQPDAATAHRHDRGPDRVPARGPRVHRQPARGRSGHTVVRPGPPARAAARTRTSSSSASSAMPRRPRRRSRPPSPATSSSRRCTPSTQPRRSAG